jgi:hypothetical protein
VESPLSFGIKPRNPGRGRKEAKIYREGYDVDKVFRFGEVI